ncbi:MAG: hypothetical protein H6714_01970 [Myxococcales bacterium]|nr:hypothetical protein [Myxococcales bacterium]
MDVQPPKSKVPQEGPSVSKKLYVPPAIEDSAEFEPMSMFCNPAFDGLPQCPDQSV